MKREGGKRKYKGYPTKSGTKSLKSGRSVKKEKRKRPDPWVKRTKKYN